MPGSEPTNLRWTLSSVVSRSRASLCFGASCEIHQPGIGLQYLWVYPTHLQELIRGSSSVDAVLEEYQRVMRGELPGHITILSLLHFFICCVCPFLRDAFIFECRKSIIFHRHGYELWLEIQLRWAAK